MDTQTAKTLSILTFLQTIGHYPIKHKTGEFLFNSPYREDKHPSLWVNDVKGCWKDFGTGHGGNILDLVMLIFKCDLSTALKNLETVPKVRFSSFRQSEDFKNIIEIKHLQSLQNKALIQYLQERKVNVDIAKNYVSEVYYTIKDKKYFALAFKNDKDGFELRNKYFKGSTSPKYYTTIKGNSDKLNVFEGFIDYLSCLTYFKTERLKNDTIILNSLSFLNEILNESKAYISFLDNDNAGKEAFDYMQSARAKKYDSIIRNASFELYPNHKDFNDFINNTIC
jgi:DNA primase